MGREYGNSSGTVTWRSWRTSAGVCITICRMSWQSSSCTVGITRLGCGWGIQVVTDFNGHWDIQGTATAGIMSAAKENWTVSLGRLNVPEFKNAEGAGSEVGVGFAAAVAAGYNFIAAYDEEGNRIGEGGMFYIGGGAAFPVVDVHVGVLWSGQLMRRVL